MPNTAVDLVTVSREYGAGGSDFATALAARLGWPVLDRNIVERVAMRLHLQSGAVQRCDEQTPGWLGRIASALLISPPDAPVQVEASSRLMPDSIAQAAHAEIVDAAAHPPVVIVGHGAQMIFRDRAGTIHVRLTATEQSRVERLMQRDGFNHEQATSEAHRVNGQRQAYVQRYYHQYWAEPLLFDVQFNTTRLTIDDAVSFVASMIAERTASPASPAHVSTE